MSTDPTGDRSSRPEPLEFDPEAVPAKLRDRDQWVCWRYQWNSDRDEWTKVPVDPNTGRLASSTDPETWTAFDAAVDYHEWDETGTDGVGFVVHEEDPVVGIDLDDCRDPDTGDLEAWADDLLDDVPTYAEVSPSGTGLRLFGFGSVPDGGTRADVDGAEGHMEMYETGRYLTVTGHALDETPGNVRQVASEIADVHAEYIADDEPADEPVEVADDGGVKTQTSGSNPGESVGKQGSTDLSDEQLIEKAKNAENGNKFRRLWEGDTTDYPSQSEADLALCDLLAFWTGGDRHRIDRLFRRSGLYRDKWDRDDYRKRTINTALRGKEKFYDPNPAPADESADTSTVSDESGDKVAQRFVNACDTVPGVNPTVVSAYSRDGERVEISVKKLVGGYDAIDDAILVFNEDADNISGRRKQDVVGRVVLGDLRDRGEFFARPDGTLYYFDSIETTVYRVDPTDGRKDFSPEFTGLLTDRYGLLSGRFSRNLGKDIKRRARRNAPERDVYQFAHYDDDSGELYVTDFEDGYWTVTPGGLEWRANGSDVFFLPDDRAEPYEYLDAGDRPTLPDQIPGERELWEGSGDPLMRLFGNRVNFAEGAALGPADQRTQLYLHLHTFPFIDTLDARPIMAWAGEKGSGKTVLQRSIGRFIFGDQFTESAMPDSQDDFFAKVTNQTFAFVDNYDDGRGWANDILAAVATGAGIDRRELYTTNALRTEVPRCWLSLTSRDPPFRRDDVADRTLVFRVERVDDGFVGSRDYQRQVSAHRDLLWSQYLDNLQAHPSLVKESQDSGVFALLCK